MATNMLNEWIGMGRLTADPELKQTTNGTKVCQFMVAIERSTDKQSGQKITDFIEIVAWSQTAEFVTRYFKKGSMICVVGSVQTRSWTAQDGSKRYKTEIVADRVYFTGEKANTATGQNAGATGYTPNWEQVSNDDDLPF